MPVACQTKAMIWGQQAQLGDEHPHVEPRQGLGRHHLAVGMLLEPGGLDHVGNGVAQVRNDGVVTTGCISASSRWSFNTPASKLAALATTASASFTTFWRHVLKKRPAGNQHGQENQGRGDVVGEAQVLLDEL